MRFCTQSHGSSLVLLGTLCVALCEDRFLGSTIPLQAEYTPMAPPRPPYNSDLAYTEVMTPYYHYYYYAPYFKASFLKHLNPQFQEQDYRSFNIWRPVEDGFYTPQNAGSSGNEYSPKFNDVGFPNYVTPFPSTKYRDEFLEKHYSTTFNLGKPPLQNPTLDVTQSFLPSALSSSDSNIIRNDDGGGNHRSLFKPKVYAPSFENSSPQPNNYFHPNPSVYKPTRYPSLFSSTTPNIIRDEVPSVNKLFKPVSSTPTPLPSVPSPSPPFSSNPYSTLPSSIVSSTLTPSTLRINLPDEAVQETLSPIFTSLSPLNVSPTTPAAFRSLSQEIGSTTASPVVLFEAPGHNVPRK